MFTNKISRGVLGTASALALMVSVSQAAKADVYAESILRVTGFQIIDTSDGLAFTAAELAPGSGGNSADDSASLGSVGGVATDTGSANITAAEGFGEIDLANVCQGDCPATADNDFTLQQPQAAPANTAHFAQADQLLEGAAINTGAIQTGADAQTAARSGLQSTDSGSATANTGTEVTVQFTAGVNATGQFVFDYELFLTAFVDEETSESTSNATASSSWTLTFVEENTGTTLVETSDIAGADALTDNVSRNDFNAQFSETDTVTDSGSLSSPTFTLVAGFNYTLTITHIVTADTTLTVPEPTTAGLFGMGLIGLGLVVLYRRKLASSSASEA